MTNTPATENCIIESRLYGFLARLWIVETDEDVLRAIGEEATRELWQSLGGFVPEGDPADLVEQLGFEYCGCFLGPKGHLPPHQSVVEQSHFQGQCLSSMNRFVEIVGLPENELFDSCRAMPDHVGFQLALMARICDSEANSNSEQKAEIAELKRTFFQHHLVWIERYCTVAIERTSSDFYRGLFIVTQAFLEQVALNLRVSTH